MRISEKSSDEFSKKLQEKIIEISIEQKMSLGIEESIEKSEKTGTYEEKILLNAKIEMYENRYRDSSDENIQAKIDKFKEFFDKYFGIGGSKSFTDQETKTAVYNFEPKGAKQMAAEFKAPYENNDTE